MADGTEIERLIVRLVGDSQNYLKMLAESQQQTKASMQDIEKTVTKTQEHIQEQQKTLGQAIGAAGVASAFIHLGKEAVSGFAEAESAEFRLRAALEANGKAVESTFQDYKKFAEQLQEVTTVEDDAVISMFQMAESYGVSGEAAKRAIKNATALAAAKGGEATSYLRLTTALEQGNAAMLVRQLPALRAIKDEAERTAKAHEMLAKMFKVAEAETQTFAGQMKQLKVAYGNMLEDFGGILVGWLKPIVSGVRQIVSWFQGLSESVKKAIVLVSGVFAIASVASFIGALNSVIPVLGTLISIIKGIGIAIAAVFSPIGAIVALAAAGIYLLIQQLGGFEAVWDMIKTAAMDMWEGIQPILMQVWTMGKQVFSLLWDFVQWVFNGIFAIASYVWSGIGITATSVFTTIRDVVLDTLLFAEFAFKNMGQVATVMWVNLEYQAVKFFNQIIYFFTDVIPASVKWFADNWQDVFTDIYNFTETVFTNLGDNIIKVWDAVWEFIKSGGTSGFEIDWTPLTAGFESAIKELPDIPERVIGDLEQKLADEADNLNAALGEEFAAFKSNRLQQFDEQNGLKDEVKKAGDVALPEAEKVSKAISSALGKWDAAESGTSEALSRQLASLEAIAVGASKEGGGKRGRSAGSPGAFEGHEAMKPVDIGEEFGKGDDLASISKGINKLVNIGEQQLREPKIELQESGIA